MAGSNRKRFNQGECWEDIESNEEDNVDHSPPRSLEDAIEEYEEPNQSDRGSCSYSSSYPPLDVRMIRTNGTGTSSVNSERTLHLGRKTILYGQTPRGICRKQLKAMAELNGMSLGEFAKQIAASSTSGSLNVLRHFHTRNQPELSVLFDDLEKYVPSVSETSFDQTGDEAELSLRNSAAFIQSEVARSGQQRQHTQTEYERFNSSENIYNADDSESFSQLATCYADLPTVHAHELGESIANNDRLKEKKNAKQCFSEIVNLASNKTIISETDSDTSEGTNSQMDSEGNQDVSHSPQHLTDVNEMDVDSGIADQNNMLGVFPGETHKNPSSTSPESSLPSSVTSNVFDSIIRRRNTQSLECSDEQTNINLESTDAVDTRDYNNFLNDLLFDEIPKVHDGVTLCGDNITTGTTNARHIYQQESNSILREKVNESNKQMNTPHRAEQRNIRVSEPTRRDGEQTRIVRQCSGSYNKVLDNLLFDEPCSPLPSCSKSTEQTVGNVGRSLNHPTGHCYNSSSKNIVNEIFDTSQRINTAKSCQQNVSPRVERKSDSVVNNSDNFPSSLELRESLWETLDASLEF